MSYTPYNQQTGEGGSRFGNFLRRNQGSMINSGISMLGGFIGAGNQHRRQRELMDLQHQNQRDLNQQGHELQMDMWNRTNYGAQVEHMKKAGLSPGLMYGMGGGGGSTTGSQTGGNASGGQATPWTPMDLSNMALMDAQRRNIDADTDNKNADTDLINANVKNVDKDTLKKIQETSNLKTQQQLMEFEKGILKLRLDKKVTGSAFVDLLTQVGLDPVNNTNDRIFLNALLSSLGILRAGQDIAKIYATIKSRGMNQGLDKAFQYGKANWGSKTIDGKGVTQAPKGLQLPNR
jgi:hypothetical protein